MAPSSVKLTATAVKVGFCDLMAHWALRRRYDQDEAMMTHKFRGSIIVLSISKSVKPNEE